MIVFPWAICLSDNRRHALQKGARRIILASGYRNALEVASMLVRGQRDGKQAIPGPVELRYTVHEPDRRRRDWGNWMKLIGDALTNGGAIIDDSDIDRIVAQRGAPDKGTPRIEITVLSLQP